MDPDATIKVMRDENADYDDRLDAAQSLTDWLGIRGYPPLGMTRRETQAEIATFFAGEANANVALMASGDEPFSAITEAAHAAAVELVKVGHASVVLTPGDMTAYQIMVGAPEHRINALDQFQSRDYWVASQFGKLYPWSGESYLTDEYAAAKYADGHRPTGAVIARFLNALATALMAVREVGMVEAMPR